MSHSCVDPFPLQHGLPRRSSPVLSTVDRDALDPLVEGMRKRVIANWAGRPHQASWLTLCCSCGSSLTFKVSPWWWASSSGRSNVGQRGRLGLGGRSTGKEVRDCRHGWCLGSFGTGSSTGKEVRDCCHGRCHCPFGTGSRSVMLALLIL
jgi:hypothetical protein